MFSINGFALDNEELGWVVLAGSTVVSSFEKDLLNLTAPNRDGVKGGLVSRARPTLVPIVVETPRANDPTLRALFMQPTLILTEEGQDDIEAEVELAAISPETYGPADAMVETSAMLRIPGVYWRDSDVTTSDAEVIDDDEITIDVFDGLTAPVRDALVRVHGGAVGLRIAGAGGSFLEYTETLDTDEYLRLDSATGKAWLTTSDTWTGGTEVSGKIQHGAPPYFLQIAPTFTTPADPTDRVGRLIVTTTSHSGSPTVEVRGKAAHAR